MDSIFKNISGNNGHPSEDDLLLFVDGELASKAAEHVRDHLEACWSCRVRTEKIEETISTFIDYRNQVLKSLVESPPHGWHGFDGRLNRLSREIGRPSLFANVRGALGRILSAPSLAINLRLAYRPIAVALALVLIAVIVLRFNRTSVVSASELLTRASEAQERVIAATDQAVVYQKLQVKRRILSSSTPETTVWEVWNDTANARSRQSVDVSGSRQFIHETDRAKTASPNRATAVPPSLSSLANVLRANHMSTTMPLSAKSFDAWRSSVVRRHDEVTKTQLADGHDSLTLRTSSTGQANIGEIIEASLTVRAGDWHPVQENLVVKTNEGNEEFELVETAYSVVSLNTIAPEIFADSPAAASSPTYSPAAIAKKESETTLAPSAQPITPVLATTDLEVEVLQLLHEAKADLGEQITATRRADGLLYVSGIVDTAERKSEIMRALQPVMSNPVCRVEIQTVAEAVAQQQQQRIRSKVTPAPNTEQKIEINSEAIAAAPELRRHFANDEELRQFSARMISQSRSAMRHAYAMKRLMSQFSTDERKTLSPEARTKWIALIRSHARDYENEIAALRRELQPIFGGASLGSGASGAEIKDDASLAHAVDQLFSLASANDAVIRSAFSASSETSATSAINSPQFWRSLNSAEGLAATVSRAQ
jgi:hypothetical protein